MMEDGAMPGEGLTALQTALYFFLAAHLFSGDVGKK